MPLQDVIIIGAGIAGLTAAHRLVRRNIPVLLLEARDRLGGRIQTHRSGDIAVPIELGAEFIHGRPESLWRLIGQAGATAYDVVDEHAIAEGTALRPRKDFWEAIEGVLGRLEGLESDCSLAEFLRTRCADVPADARNLAAQYVEGFDAAHLDQVSALSLRNAQRAGEKIDLDTPFRLIEGYDTLIHHLHSGITGSGCARICLNEVVREIAWSPGEVRVTSEGASEPLIARAAIITLPIGVLQAAPGQVGAVRFDPPLPSAHRQAIESLRAGPVIKVILDFRERFWEGHGDPAFIHRAESAFPTWWTTRPLRTGLLTAWAGGPAADALAGLDEQALVQRAIDELAASFPVSRNSLTASLRSTYVGNWQTDPFARGAYSYAAVGGASAAAALAAPIDQTLFIAGEATNPDIPGTVAGAIDSAYRAVADLTAALT